MKDKTWHSFKKAVNHCHTLLRLVRNGMAVPSIQLVDMWDVDGVMVAGEPP